MNKFLSELILEMADKTPYTDSKNSISWQAYRKAEKIENHEYANELIEYIPNEKDKTRRGASYFILGKISKNKNHGESISFLISRLNEETDKYLISEILDRLGEISKPKTEDLSNIIKLLGDKRWLVRHSAIAALKYSEHANVESVVLNHLSKTNDFIDQAICNSVLNQLGTEKSIQVLETFSRSKKRDVKLSANLAIQEIRKRSVK